MDSERQQSPDKPHAHHRGCRALAGPHPLPPDRMSASERMAELAVILAAGLVRLRARQSSGLSAVLEKSSVDFAADQSGGHPATQAETNP